MSEQAGGVVQGASSARVRRGAVAFVAVGVLAGCAGAGGAGGGGGEEGDAINVLMVGNPQMEDLRELTAANFTEETGIDVNITILPENELRDRVTQDIATQGGQYDVVTIGAYEAQIWAENNWLTDVSGVLEDEEYDGDDVLEPMVQSLTGEDGTVYALPFYGESSFLMYRKDILEQAGITMPERPTWDEVADIAAQIDTPQTAGICLRGLPGWGELFAPLTSVVNTFGGTWFTEDWEAQVDSPEFTEATQFYVDLVTQYGEDGAAQAGFTECLGAMTGGTAAMWYDATSAAGSLEDPATSDVAGKIGYAYAPVKETDSSGWLWAWSLAIPETTEHSESAQEYIKWATSKEYEELVGNELGWSRVPAGKRASTYEIPEYAEAAAAFGDITLKSIEEADPTNPGVQPRPTTGIQFVAIPEFADLGTTVSQEISAVIANGGGSVDQALANGQREAAAVAEEYAGQ